MSDISDLERVFIDEATEMVQMFEESILDIERNPENEQAINSAFRAVHTLKGGAASMGYSNLEKISHSIEDLLDYVRAKKVSLSLDVINILLDGAKVLRSTLNAILSSSQVEYSVIESISNRISSIINSSVSSLNISDRPVKETNLNINQIKLENLSLSNEVIKQIQELFSENRRSYLLEITFREDSPLKEVGVLQIVSLIRDSSQIIDSTPSLEDIYVKFYEKVSFIISTDDINKTFQRINISDIVDNIRVYQIMQQEKVEGESVKENRQETVESAEVRSSILRIESSKVDRLMNIVGELVVNRSNINENVFYLGEMINEISGYYYDVTKSIRTLSSQLSIDMKEVSEDMAEKFQNYLNIISNINQIVSQINNRVMELKKRYDNLSNGIKLFNSISIDIQERFTDLRMIPIKYLFSRLPLFVREISSQLGKEINLIVKGEDTNLDKSVIDELFDPIVHIVRNSIDHGIEDKEERISKGKSPRGNIIIEAFNEGGSVIIRIRDDGRGIDFDKIRQRGVEKGLLREGVEYDKEYLLSLIFLPGFSTKDQVSSLSGRGVGMDIVKAKIEKLRGNLMIATSKDKGTSFTIKLPLTIAIMKVLLFEIKGIIFAIPVNSIEEALTIRKDEITTFEGKSVVKIRDEVIKVYSLRDIYFDDSTLNDDVDVLIVSYLGKKYALVIDKFLKEEDIFLRPIDHTLVSPPGVVSATILGNGKVGYVIDIGNLVEYLEKQTKSKISTQV
ncbi:MAG: chemotaxis protein CheA [Spirochaetia bacterium]|nr:chemotaxis protein CheA [Spirochaetota bacterium]MCX8096483.1 chemotaxis protein CheA [Spirochaetota bacterium]MDW8113159.1 chemotaxis protein CheA [Spirochaetia bacterium]